MHDGGFLRTILRPIHRSAWKGYSEKFASNGVLRSSGCTGPPTVAGRALLEVSLWTQKSDSVFAYFGP
jgi:hypothetical protein